MSSKVFARPATSFHAAMEKPEICEHNNKSNVCRLFSPLMVVAVKAGVMKMMRRS